MTFICIILMIIAFGLAGALGLRWNQWKLEDFKRQRRVHLQIDADVEASWRSYQERAEIRIEQLESDLRTAAPAVEALQAANATINELEARLARTPARDRFNREPTGQWARRLITEIREPVTHEYRADEEAEQPPSLTMIDAYAALATVTEENSQEIVIERQRLATAAPVRTYPAKRAPRRKRRR